MHLNLIFSILLLSLIFQFFIPLKHINILRIISFVSSGMVFYLSCLLIIKFKLNGSFFRYEVEEYLGLKFLNGYGGIGFDSLSLLFFSFSSLLVFLSLLYFWNKKNFKDYFLRFTSFNLLLFIILFEYY